MEEKVQHTPQPTEPYKENTITGSDCITTVQENHCSEHQTCNSIQFVSLNQVKQNWKNIVTVVCLWFTYLSYSANYSLIGALFPNEAIAKGCSSTIVGVIISVSPLCVVLLSPLVGYFLSHVGLRFTLLSGIFLVGGAFTLQGFLEWMPSGRVFISFGVVLKMTEGVGSAMFITALFTLLPELYPDRVGLVKGLFEVAGGIGYSIGPLIGGNLYMVGGFKLPFVVFGVSTLVLTTVSLLFVRHSSKSYNVKPLSLKLIWKLLSTFIIFTLLIAHILSQAAMSFFSPILQPFLTNEKIFSHWQGSKYGKLQCWLATPQKADDHFH